MLLRLLSHDAFAGSYNSQFFHIINENSLEDILHDLECCAHTILVRRPKKSTVPCPNMLGPH